MHTHPYRAQALSLEREYYRREILRSGELEIAIYRIESMTMEEMILALVNGYKDSAASRLV